jgi:AcrR family transcriptional regulator
VRPLRRDAELNRQRILKAAAEVFTERGFAATLDDVARHAGVGVGTVYRRFPDKAALADALFDERIDGLIALAEQAAGEPDAWASLVAFLERSAEMLAGDLGLRQLLMFAAHSHDRALYARSRMRPAITALVERAQAAGQVRPDIRATDIPVIELMISAVADYTKPVQPAIWRRYLALMLDALSPAGARPLPEPPLTPDEMVEVIRASGAGR